ncbi:MAG TPA: YfcE family phosphodiesterase [Phycisphaerae bacterium]|nr:YfcE family phosphodiesterase [Phycisphaerae bacterium]
MSDSHGRVDRVRRACDLFRQLGVQAVIHCGDIGGMEVLEELSGWQAWFIWGNTDFPRPAWRPQVEALQLPWPDGQLEITLAGKRIAVFHGHELGCQLAMAVAEHDYLFHGHTHQPDDYLIERMRVINPGALHRVRLKTVAVLDLASDALDFLPVDDQLTSDDEILEY